MSITIIISEIIQQLLKGSHSDDIFEEIDNKIVSLTPIVKVSEGASTELEPENSFYAEMELPKGVMPTLIVSKELYPMYLELPSDEFISRLNKTLFDYINEQLTKDRTRGVHDGDNIWVKPNATFVNWFHKKYLIHKDIVPFNQSNKDEEYYSKGGCTKAQLAYIKLYNLTNEYIDQNPKTADGKEMSINKAVIIVYSDNKEIFPNWADSSLNSYYYK